MKISEIEINGKKTDVSICFTNLLPSGYGHYSINGEAFIGKKSKKIKYITSNMLLIDAFKNSDSEEEVELIKKDMEDELFDENFDEITYFFNNINH